MIYELRQYTMVPGRRDEFADYFDRHFVESQEALGISVIGQFRDLDRADRYVWMRAYPDMETRGQVLNAFYDGSYWAATKDAANAMMTEWHDILLLKPAWDGSGLQHEPAGRAAAGSPGSPAEGFTVTVWNVEPDVLQDTVSACRDACPDAVAVFVTEPSPNNFLRHPIREGENVLVCIARGASAEAPSLKHAGDPIQILRMMPTARSALR